MIDLYSWPTPNGHKLHIMMEETGLDYKIIGINIGKGDQFDPEFLNISPNNKIPALLDPDGPGGKPLALFETGAMLVYLAEKSGQFMPPAGTAEWFSVMQWLMFQMGGVGPMFGQQNHFNNYGPKLADAAALEYGQNRYNNEVQRLYGVMDTRLGEVANLGGDDYSIADIATFPWARGHERRVDIKDFPNVQRWLDELDARPAVKRGLEVLSEERRAPGEGPDKEALENMFGAVQYVRR